MSTPTGFQVEPEQIRAHARSVGELAQQLSSAAGGAPGALGANALGGFVQFLTSVLQGAMTKATDSVTHASSGVDTVRDSLARAADSYQSIDEQHAAQLRQEQPR